MTALTTLTELHKVFTEHYDRTYQRFVHAILANDESSILLYFNKMRGIALKLDNLLEQIETQYTIQKESICSFSQDALAKQS